MYNIINILKLNIGIVINCDMVIKCNRLQFIVIKKSLLCFFCITHQVNASCGHGCIEHRDTISIVSCVFPIKCGFLCE